MTIKTKQITPRFGLCLDWETSGATWSGDSSIEYQGLTFGAVVFDVETLEPVKTLYCEIKFDESKYKWADSAEKIHGKSREYLAQHGISQEEAAELLGGLILEYFGTGKVMFMGHNANFDIRFTNQLMQVIGIEFGVERKTEAAGWIEVHHVVLDTSGMGFIALGLYKSDLLFDAIGLEERGEHNALTDALYTLQTANAIRQLVKIAMEG